MKRKVLLMLASMGLLVVVIVYGTIAWYTNISNVTGMTFDVAEFKFETNYNADNFLIQVDEYLTSDTDKAAPGTGGVIPIRVSVKGNSGAVYAINLDFSNMDEEFKKRIRFYYYTKDGDVLKENLLDENAADIVGTIAAGTEGANGESSVTEFIYWEWIYTADITPILVAPIVSGSSVAEWTNFEHMDQMTYEQIESAVKNWVNYSGNSAVEAKYQELAGLGHTAHMDPKSSTFAALANKTGRELKQTIEAQYLEAHDKFDTDLAMGKFDDTYVGKSKTYNKDTTPTTILNANGTQEEIILKAYQRAMEVTLMVSGAQAAPLKKTDKPGSGWTSNGTTVYVAD